MEADTELLQAWRRGDERAGDRLIQRHFDSVCRFFRFKLGDDVEDLIQSTFLACVEGRERIADGGFRPYLFAVARNILFERLRAVYRGGEKVDLSEMSLADLGTSPSRAVARQREHQTLLAALHHLGLDQRIAVELSYWEGMRAPEIATVLGVSPHTVRSRLARARAELRSELAKLRLAPEVIESTLAAIERGAAKK